MRGPAIPAKTVLKSSHLQKTSRQFGPARWPSAIRAVFNPLVSAPRLHKCLSDIFPSLKQTRISHSWMGFVAYTFDTLPHLGQQDGLHYAMGYCGSGVSLATYFGMRVGQQVLGKAEGKTALDNVAFQTRPLYTGNPWFLAPSVWWYRLLDKMPI